MNIKSRALAAILILILCVLNTSIYFANDMVTAEKLGDAEIKGDINPEEAADVETDLDIIIPVLMYHNLAESYPKGSEGANITPRLFEEQMIGILNEGYTPIFVADYYDCVQRGEKLPHKPIIITFDDGYLSNYEIAYPILKRLNIPATIFIVTSTVGATAEGGMVSTPHFNWEQAREMQQSGIVDIHSHSHTHRNMTSISPAELQEELRISRYLIEKNLNKSCFVFSYPFGGYNEVTSNLSRFAGYRMQILVNYAESGQDYLANSTKSGIEHFTRLTVRGDMSVEDLFDIIDTAIENTKNMVVTNKN